MPGYPCPGPRIAPSDQWDMYGIELELGTWSYRLDIVDIVYGPGLYPFHRPVTRIEAHPTAPLLTHRVPTGQTRPAGVRLSPDVAEYAWSNEYVLLEPFGHRVLARTRLFTGRDGAKVMVRPIEIELNLREQRITLPIDCPAALREQATVKAGRILELLRAASAERDSGGHQPITVLPQLACTAVEFRKDDAQEPGQP